MHGLRIATHLERCQLRTIRPASQLHLLGAAIAERDRAPGLIAAERPGREPIVTYQMAPRDRATLPRLVRLMGETFLAAGAVEVFPPVIGQPGLDADGFNTRHLRLDGSPIVQDLAAVLYGA